MKHEWQNFKEKLNKVKWLLHYYDVEFVILATVVCIAISYVTLSVGY